MTFQEIEYPFEYYLLKIKYESDNFWDLYSRICLPFVFGFWVYKLIKPIKFNSVEEYKKMKKPMQDKILQWFVGYAPLYYFIDSIFLIFSGLIWLNRCRMYLLFHHFASFSFLPLICFSKYIPWWQITPAWFHTVLLVWPQQGWFLNYPYGICLLISHHGFYRKIFRELTLYKALQIGVIFGYMSQICLLVEQCDNQGHDYSYLYNPTDPRNMISEKYPEYNMSTYSFPKTEL